MFSFQSEECGGIGIHHKPGFAPISQFPLSPELQIKYVY